MNKGGTFVNKKHKTMAKWIINKNGRVSAMECNDVICGKHEDSVFGSTMENCLMKQGNKSGGGKMEYSMIVITRSLDLLIIIQAHYPQYLE